MIYLVLIMSSLSLGGAVLPHGVPSSQPSSQPVEEEIPHWDTVPSDTLRKTLIEKLGQDPNTEGDIQVLLVGTGRDRSLDINAMRGGKYRYDADKVLIDGYVVRIKTACEEVKRGNAGVPHFLMSGTVSVYTLKGNLAVDFKIDVVPTKEYPEDDYRVYPITGTVEWSEVRKIPYDRSVWPDFGTVPNNEVGEKKE